MSEAMSVLESLAGELLCCNSGLNFGVMKALHKEGYNDMKLPLQYLSIP